MDTKYQVDVALGTHNPQSWTGIKSSNFPPSILRMPLSSTGSLASRKYAPNLRIIINYY